MEGHRTTNIGGYIQDLHRGTNKEGLRQNIYRGRDLGRTYIHRGTVS